MRAGELSPPGSAHWGISGNGKPGSAMRCWPPHTAGVRSPRYSPQTGPNRTRTGLQDVVRGGGLCTRRYVQGTCDGTAANRISRKNPVWSGLSECPLSQTGKWDIIVCTFSFLAKRANGQRANRMSYDGFQPATAGGARPDAVEGENPGQGACKTRTAPSSAARTPGGFAFETAASWTAAAGGTCRTAYRNSCGRIGTAFARRGMKCIRTTLLGQRQNIPYQPEA